jgi:hypothetical protein
MMDGTSKSSSVATSSPAQDVAWAAAGESAMATEKLQPTPAPRLEALDASEDAFCSATQ